MASWGPLRLRADVGLQFGLGESPLRVVNPNVADRRTSTIDDHRSLRTLGTSTVALEAGTGDRFTTAGLFVAARGGFGLGYWGAGPVHRRTVFGEPVKSNEFGYGKAVVTVGGETGLWVGGSDRPHRIALRIDGVHAEGYSTTRISFGIQRHW